MSPELVEQLLDAAAKIGRYDKRDPFAILGFASESADELKITLQAGGYRVTIWELWGYLEGWLGIATRYPPDESDAPDRYDYLAGGELGRAHREEWTARWAAGPLGAAITPLCTREGVPHELRAELARQQREGEATDLLCTQCGHLYSDHQGADNDVSEFLARRPGVQSLLQKIARQISARFGETRCHLGILRNPEALESIDLTVLIPWRGTAAQVIPLTDSLEEWWLEQEPVLTDRIIIDVVFSKAVIDDVKSSLSWVLCDCPPSPDTT